MVTAPLDTLDGDGSFRGILLSEHAGIPQGSRIAGQIPESSVRNSLWYRVHIKGSLRTRTTLKTISCW
mgnify:CR=1 FL=1